MKIAITGGIAEGKSTVLQMIADAGYRVDSADTLSRQVFLQEGVQKALGALLGTTLPVDPVLLREKMADRQIRRSVNQIMHPSVLAALHESRAQFVEVPLLIETCLQGKFLEVWVVTCGREEQLARLTLRYGNGPQAESLLGGQLPTRAKLPFADRIVRTNQDLDTVRRIVNQNLTSL